MPGHAFSSRLRFVSGLEITFLRLRSSDCGVQYLQAVALFAVDTWRLTKLPFSKLYSRGLRGMWALETYYLGRRRGSSCKVGDQRCVRAELPASQARGKGQKIKHCNLNCPGRDSNKIIQKKICVYNKQL